MHLQLARHPSPLGMLLIVSDEDTALRAIDYVDYEARLHKLLRIHYQRYELSEAPAPAPITTALDAYFTGKLDSLLDIPVATGGTAFQREIWQALRRIPAGGTVSYRQLAQQMGRPSASRAVGLANGANPVAIVVPCHRVVGSSGALTGYAGGLERKRWLLDHESPQRRMT